MTQKIIYLEFDKMETYLTGRNFASEIFKDQVKKQLDTIDEDVNTIIIEYPKQIKGISISFTKQILSEIEKKMKNKSNLSIEFKTKSSVLNSKVKEDVLY